MPGVALCRVLVEIVETQHDVGKFLVAVRGFERSDRSPIISNLDLHARCVGQGVEEDLLSVGRTKWLLRGFGSRHSGKSHNGEGEYAFHHRDRFLVYVDLLMKNVRSYFRMIFCAANFERHLEAGAIFLE